MKDKKDDEAKLAFIKDYKISKRKLKKLQEFETNFLEINLINKSYDEDSWDYD